MGGGVNCARARYRWSWCEFKLEKSIRSLVGRGKQQHKPNPVFGKHGQMDRALGPLVNNGFYIWCHFSETRIDWFLVLDPPSGLSCDGFLFFSADMTRFDGSRPDAMRCSEIPGRE